MINNGEKMELKDKLNLLWKFLFLAVFTYGVISLTCCRNSCSSFCKNQSAQVAPCKAPCGTNCTKPCCAKSDKAPCGTNCTKPCCAKTK